MIEGFCPLGFHSFIHRIKRRSRSLEDRRLQSGKRYDSILFEIRDRVSTWILFLENVDWKDQVSRGNALPHVVTKERS